MRTCRRCRRPTLVSPTVGADRELNGDLTEPPPCVSDPESTCVAVTPVSSRDPTHFGARTVHRGFDRTGAGGNVRIGSVVSASNGSTLSTTRATAVCWTGGRCSRHSTHVPATTRRARRMRTRRMRKRAGASTAVTRFAATGLRSSPYSGSDEPRFRQHVRYNSARCAVAKCDAKLANAEAQAVIEFNGGVGPEAWAW